MESSRRQQAQSDLGMNFEREDLKRNAALAKEQERVAKTGKTRTDDEPLVLPHDGENGKVYG